VTVRDVLFDRARDVTTIVDLEAFTVSIATFFGEYASVIGAAARPCDCSVRSQGVRRRAVIVRRERALVGQGQHLLNIRTSGEARED